MKVRVSTIGVAIAAFAVLTIGYTQPTKEKAVSDEPGAR